jgi:hypothetical protein
MPATLHTYTKNALLYTAQYGISAGWSGVLTVNGWIGSSDQNRLIAVFCSTGSSLFDANFEGTLKNSSNTGLLDSGVTQTGYGEFANTYSYYSIQQNLFITTSSYGSNNVVAYKIGRSTLYGGPVFYESARSVLLCMHTGANNNDVPARLRESYPLYMIDFGQTITPSSSQYGAMQWDSTTPAALEMSLA